MNEQRIIEILGRKATWLSTGGFRPTHALSESWVARIFLYREHEDIPLDKQGLPMLPLLLKPPPGRPFARK